MSEKNADDKPMLENESGLMQLETDVEGDLAKEIENVPVPPVRSLIAKYLDAAKSIWWIWAIMIMGIVSYFVLKMVFVNR